VFFIIRLSAFFSGKMLKKRFKQTFFYRFFLEFAPICGLLEAVTWIRFQEPHWKTAVRLSFFSGPPGFSRR